MSERYHGFEAVRVGDTGRESVLRFFRVTAKRSAAEAYDEAEKLCEQARAMPHKPVAFVREINPRPLHRYAREDNTRDAQIMAEAFAEIEGIPFSVIDTKATGRGRYAVIDDEGDLPKVDRDRVIYTARAAS